MAPATRVALVAIVACVALCSAQQDTATVNLDGSGTSNFLPLLLRVLETVKVRAKPTPSTTYRTTGTGPGRTEIQSGTTALQFACGGGLPMNDANILDVPVAISTVSVYVTLNGLQTGQLQLDACTIAKIFNGQITKWNDKAILDANGDSAVQSILNNLQDQQINVFYHGEGSSTTWALTSYLQQAAGSACWANGNDLQFSKIVPITASNFFPVTTTQDMVTKLSTTLNAIGYVESGQGMTAGLTEVAIQYKASRVGTHFMSYQDKGNKTQVLLGNSIKTLTAANAGTWSGDQSGLIYNLDVWPMTLINYVHLRKDMSAMGPAGGLALYMATLFFRNETTDLMPQYNLRPVWAAEADRNSAITQLNTTVATATTWFDERTTWSSAYLGSNFSVSSLRQDYLMDTVTTLSASTAKNRAMLKQGGTYQLHGGGAFQAADYMRSLMATLQGQARAPIHATFRDVGTVQAQNEILDTTTSIPNLNNFKVGDVPLNKTAYDTLSSCTDSDCLGVLHLPFAIGSVSVFFKQQLPSQYFGLDACTASKVFSGSVKTWSDTQLSANAGTKNSFAQGDNSFSYVKKPITVFVYAGESSANQILKGWLMTCAGTSWTNDIFAMPAVDGIVNNTYVNGTVTKAILTPQDMQDALALTPGSIGFMPTNLGLAAGLDEASLLSTEGNDIYVRAQDVQPAALRSNKDTVFQKLVKAQALEQKTAQEDWSTVNFLSVTGVPGYPLTTLLYVYVYQDLSGFGDSGPLTKALFKYMYSDPGQQLLVDAGLTPMPDTLVSHFQQELEKLKLAPLLAEWNFETLDSITNAGMELQTFSEARLSSDQALLQGLMSGVNTLRDQIAQGVVVRGAGPATANIASLIREMMDDLTVFASAPVRFTFEDVPYEEMGSIVSMLQNQGDFAAQTGFLVLDQPLTKDQHENNPSLLQSPLMIRPLSFIYMVDPKSNDTQVKLAPCTVAGILSGQITSWNQLATDNPGLQLPNTPITLLAAYSTTGGAAGDPSLSGDLKAVIDYCTAQCPGTPVTFDQVGKVAQARTDILAEVLAAQPYTMLGIGFGSWAIDHKADGLRDAALQTIAVNGQSTNAFKLAGDFGADAYSDCMLMKIVPNNEDYRSVLDDWSNFTLSGSCAPPFTLESPPDNIKTTEVYPLLRTDFLVMPASLVPYGLAGGALKGMAQYMFDSNRWQSQTLPLKVPFAVPLPSEQWSRSSDIHVLLQLEDNTPEWPVITNTLANTVKLNPTDRPFITSFVASTTGGGSSSGGNQLGVSVAAAAARQAAQEYLQNNAAQFSSTVESKDSSKSRLIAIIALAVALGISLISLILALFALRDARRALANSYRPSSLAQVLPATHGMQMMAQMNANPPALHPAALQTQTSSRRWGLRAAAAAALNPSQSYNSRTAPRRTVSNRMNDLRSCLSGVTGGVASPDDKFQVFMENQHGVLSPGSSSDSAAPDIKIEMRPNDV